MWENIKHLWDDAYSKIKDAWKAIFPEFTKLWRDIVKDSKALGIEIFNFLKNTILNAFTMAFAIISAPLKSTWVILVDVILKTLSELFKYAWNWIVLKIRKDK